MDNANPAWVWYIGGMLCAIAVGGFYALHSRTGARVAAQPIEQPVPIEP